jgi:hypothetical protein
MSDFLSNLVSKSRGAVEAVRARQSALFEPTVAAHGLAIEPSAAPDSGWREAERSAHLDSAQRRRGEWRPVSSVSPRFAADWGEVPSAPAPRLTSKRAPKPSSRPQPSPPRPLRPPSTPSVEGTQPGMAPRPTDIVQSAATPEAELSAATEAQPGATIPEAYKSGAPAGTVANVRPALRSSPEALETGPRSEPGDETNGAYRLGTAQPRPEPWVERTRPSPRPSVAVSSLDPRSEATEGAIRMARPGQSSRGDQTSPGLERSITRLRPTGERAPRPRVVAHREPGQPSGGPRQAGATRRAAEPPRPYAFPSIEPAVPPSGQPSRGGEPAPTIQVTIGRVEVRAITPPPSDAPRPRSTRPESVLTLDEYLKQRNEESR